MSKVFRARSVEGLRKRFDRPTGFYAGLFAKDWVVNCKRPFYSPRQVIEYLGRYTHKIAIGDHRIKNLEEGSVTFTAKDYRKGWAKYGLTLSDAEFIRRFALHILPKGFVRIRHYGILSSAKKKTTLPTIKAQVGDIVLSAARDPIRHGICPVCKKGNSHIRAALHMPSMTCVRCNPTLKQFYNRLKLKKAKPLVALVAVQRKLLILMFTLWKNEEVYDAGFETKKQQKYKALAARDNKLITQLVS